MRRRLVVGAVAIVVVTLLLFAVPLAVLLRQEVVRAELDADAARLEQTATLVDERSRTCAELQLTLAALAREGVELTVFDRTGDARFVGGPSDAADVRVAPEVLDSAIAGATGSGLLDGAPVVAVPLSTPVCGERLVLQAIGDPVDLDRQTRRAVLLVGLAAAVALVIGVLGASVLGTRLAVPLERLAASARRLGQGDFSERAPRAGLPEPDGIADALDQTALRLGGAVARGTAFAADASHQLRTPLTALRLHLEAAGAGLGDDDPRAAAIDGALAEVDRLTSTIDELVALTRLDEEEADVDIAQLLDERAEDWRRRAADEGRELVVESAPVPPTAVRPAAIVQATEVLVDNALRHGRGRVTVITAPPTDDSSVRVSVRDEGPGLPAGVDLAGRRRDRGGLPVTGGRGIPLARDLVEGEGGRLTLRSDDHGTIATLWIPVRPRGVRRAGTAS